MDNSNQGQCEVKVSWQSANATHCEHRYFEHVDFRRDIFPGRMAQQLKQSKRGEWIETTLSSKGLIEAHNASLDHTPKYNKIATGNLLAGTQLMVSIRVCARLPHNDRHKSSRHIILDTLLHSPGMQLVAHHRSPDFYHPECFRRIDERDDATLYSKPNFNRLIDATAEQHIQTLYAQHLQPSMRVLDLMAGHDSHLPDIKHLHVIGLGLNQEELDANPRLSQRLVHDVNRIATLPFNSNSVDAVIYTLSIEYLIQPQTLFNQVAHVCKPGAPFIITFSENSVATKVIVQWSEMQPFERMGLALDYFQKSGRFEQLHTESFCGWPRPEGGPKNQRKTVSNSIYAVMGKAK